MFYVQESLVKKGVFIGWYTIAGPFDEYAATEALKTEQFKHGNKFRIWECPEGVYSCDTACHIVHRCRVYTPDGGVLYVSTPETAKRFVEDCNTLLAHSGLELQCQTSNNFYAD